MITAGTPGGGRVQRESNEPYYGSIKRRYKVVPYGDEAKK